MDIATQMAGILGTSLAGLALLTQLQTTATKPGFFLPSPANDPSKRAYEIFCMCYTPVWITIFAVIVAFDLYEDFTPTGYVLVCGGLALPFLLQPVLLPVLQRDFSSPDATRPLLERYAFKANVWLAVYSFIGNYWYTHYFYSVLQASYTMPNAIRLNHVPICMFCATHFYFSTYHFFSNAILRKIVTHYRRTVVRDVLFVSVIGVLSYFTAFMETLSISAYPYWTFADRNMVYSIGSAFYGIYFIVSFPAFFFFDSQVDQGKGVTIWETILSSCGYGMVILLLLDFVRLTLGVPLVVGDSVEAYCAVTK